MCYRQIFPFQTKWASSKVEYEGGGEAIRYQFMIINSPKNNDIREERIKSKLKPKTFEKSSIPIDKKGALECRLIIADSKKERDIERVAPGSKLRDEKLENYSGIKSLREYAEKYIAAKEKKLSRINL